MSDRALVSNNTSAFALPITHPIWNPLRALAEDYKDRAVPRTTAQRFWENIWEIPDGFEIPVKLDFSDYVFPDGTSIGDDVNFGIRIFLKVRTYHFLQKESEKTARPFAAKSICSSLSEVRRTLIPFLQENGILRVNPISRKYRSLSNLTPSLFNVLLDEIIQSPLKKISKWGVIDSISEYLSVDKTVPGILRPSFDLCGNITFSTAVGSLNEDSEGYKPIPEDDYYWIGKSALEFCKCYAEDIIRIHKLMVDVWKTEPPSYVKATADNAKNRDRGKEKSSYHGILLWRMRELLHRMEASGVTLPQFSDEHKRYWNIEDVSLPYTDDTTHAFQDSGFTSSYCYYLFDLLFGALCTLILIPTGLRNSELRYADISRVSKSANQDGVFSYINAIKKIKPSAAFFQRNEIPIPIETWQAFRLLDRLSAPLRADCSSMICIRPLNHSSHQTVDEVDEYGTILKTSDTHRIARPHATRKAIVKFCLFIRSSTIPSPHRFRKSIAEFMLRKTKLAPILLCQLFGHKSIQMTLKYLQKNNLIRREVRQYNAERFRDGAVVMAIAYAKGAAGGPMIDRIHNAVATRDEFQGLTEREMAVELARWLMNRVLDQHLVILFTPLNLCLRSIEAKDIPPCQSKILDAYNTGLPDPSNCAGVKCAWAATTFEQAESLDTALTFYKTMLETNDRSVLQNTHLLAFATDFVETYDPIADRIRKVPIEELRTLTLDLKILIGKNAV